MIGTIFNAFFAGGVLLFGVSYFLFRWAYEGGHTDDAGDLRKKKYQNPETGKKEKYQTDNFALNKWLNFGGGYYGTVAMVTFVISEISQTLELLADKGFGIIGWLLSENFSLIPAFIINQIMTFIDAMIWPTNWFGNEGFLTIAIWFGFSYGGYKLGRERAQNDSNQAAKIEN